MIDKETDNINDNNFKSSLRVEKNISNKNLGKTYVIADIHGMYGTYMDVIKRLDKNDKLFIIGDVIDRGKNGIKILEDIIRRVKNPKEGPKITFLLGNHEMQMICCTVTRVDYDFTEEFLSKIVNDTNSFLNDKNIDRLTKSYLDIWLNYNGGYKTLLDFIKLPKEEQEEMFDFLCESYVAYSDTICDEKYLFVHASPPSNEYLISKLSKSSRSLRFSDLLPDDYEEVLEERNNSTGLQIAKQEEFTTIYGHTPHKEGVIKDDKYNSICIDAGCGHGESLALFCIEDKNVEYFKEKEDYIKESDGR